MASRRKEIVALLVDKLKEIDGQAVVGTNYTYNLNSNFSMLIFKVFVPLFKIILNNRNDRSKICRYF